MEPTFGIEEEFMLVDPETLAPVHIADSAIRELQERAFQGAVTSEFQPSQVEHATTVCSTLLQAEAELLDFRRHLTAWAQRHRVIAIGSGTPFQVRKRLPPLPSERYERIANDVGMLANDHLVNGMHVHVGIADAEEGIRVFNGLRPWLPTLLAMSANSPFWAGEDTGHHSWRAIQTRRWTTNGIPPFVRDAEEYAQLHDRLIGVGATQEYSKASWAIRLSERYPTVEVRVFDTQLNPESAVALAVLLRALAAACADQSSPPPSRVRTHVLDAELWHAARYGMSNGLYDPRTGEHADSKAVVASLVRTAAPYMADDSCRDYVDRLLDGVSAGITGATVQRHAFARGRGALAALYRDSLDAERSWSAPGVASLAG